MGERQLNTRLSDLLSEGSDHSGGAGEAARRRSHVSRISKSGVQFQMKVEGLEENRTFWEQGTISARLGAGGRGEKEKGGSTKALRQPVMVAREPG